MNPHPLIGRSFCRAKPEWVGTFVADLSRGAFLVETYTWDPGDGRVPESSAALSVLTLEHLAEQDENGDPRFVILPTIRDAFIFTNE